MASGGPKTKNQKRAIAGYLESSDVAYKNRDMQMSEKYFRRVASVGILILVAYVSSSNLEVRAEYGDIVINNYSNAAGMRPPIFPHWFHRIRFQCKICHADIGFKFKAGGNDINMNKIINGQFCGACHNGEIAWSVENCELCHSAKLGTPTQVHKSTLQTLVAPLSE